MSRLSCPSASRMRRGRGRCFPLRAIHRIVGTERIGTTFLGFRSSRRGADRFDFSGTDRETGTRTERRDKADRETDRLGRITRWNGKREKRTAIPNGRKEHCHVYTRITNLFRETTALPIVKPIVLRNTGTRNEYLQVHTLTRIHRETRA